MNVKYSHKELVEIAYKWCNNRCSFVFRELVSMGGYGEIPDVIGFRSEGTFLIEVKTTPNDFVKDKEKRFRKMPEYGMGDWRFFICKEGLIKKDRLPEMWGLLEVNEKGKVKIEFNPFGKGNIYSRWKKNKKYEKSEYWMMFSALRRIQEKGLMNEIYPNQLNK